MEPSAHAQELAAAAAADGDDVSGKTQEVKPPREPRWLDGRRAAIAGAGAREWERSWGAPAQGDPPSARRCRSMEDDAPVIYGLEFRWVRNSPAAPGAAEVTAGGLGGPKAAVIRDRPRDARRPGARRSGPLPPAVRSTAACLPPPAVPGALTLTARFAVMACEHFREPCCSWGRRCILYYYYCSNLDTVFKFT